ncbi:hypothetical protein KAS08_00450 [Candidatus Pacearchaeota archaeon]|nr:hypothetical protein [Candidatus Pacearchaeota archaeon]
MSLILNQGTKPENLRVMTPATSFSKLIFIGDYEITMKDFVELMNYVLTNTDLRSDDPRIKFINNVKKAKIVPGWNKGGSRINIPHKR